jgi:DNA-binding MarR family transcriptional regulator
MTFRVGAVAPPVVRPVRPDGPVPARMSVPHRAAADAVARITRVAQFLNPGLSVYVYYMDAEGTAAALQIAVGRLVRRLRQTHVPGQMTLSEASVLSRLDRGGPAAPGELANGERVKPQAMGSTLQSLEQRALVSRAADPGDGRRVLMTITDEGRRLLTDRRSLKTQALADAIAHLSPDERQTLVETAQILEKLAEVL